MEGQEFDKKWGIKFERSYTLEEVKELFAKTIPDAYAEVSARGGGASTESACTWHGWKKAFETLGLLVHDERVD